MSAPASSHERGRRRIELVVEREYQPDPARCIAAAIKLLTWGAVSGSSAAERSSEPPERADPTTTPTTDDAAIDRGPDKALPPSCGEPDGKNGRRKSAERR